MEMLNRKLDRPPQGMTLRQPFYWDGGRPAI
jgi:hypothetical protein